MNRLTAFFQSTSRMQRAVVVSVAFHAAVLAIPLANPEAVDRLLRELPIEVVLVNASSQEAPEDAKVVAQQNVRGGGEAEKGLATSPLSAAVQTRLGNSHEDAEKQLEALEAQQRQLLTQLKAELAAMKAAPPRESSPDPAQIAQEERRRQLLEIVAALDKRINEQNAKPRRRFVGPSARQGVQAVYYDELRSRIEEKGTQNFPEAKGQRLYGELTMSIEVDASGKVTATEVLQGSGNAVLDRQARAIVTAAGPFGDFPPAMRAKAEFYVFVARFRFTKDSALETAPTDR